VTLSSVPSGDVPDATAWILASPLSLKIDRLLFFFDTIAVLFCASIVIHALVWNATLPGVAPLLIVGIPLLAFGQAWMIIALNARRPRRIRLGRTRRFGQLGLSGEAPAFFGGLSRREKIIGYGIFFAAWLAGMTAFPSISNGNPAIPSNGCLWPLVNHGIETCVSHSAYLAAGVGLQRFAVGVLLGFYSIHMAFALSELRLRRA
jgi:hypothetical protein